MSGQQAFSFSPTDQCEDFCSPVSFDADQDELGVLREQICELIGSRVRPMREIHAESFERAFDQKAFISFISDLVTLGDELHGPTEARCATLRP
jgi:hypothetical protein